LAKALEVFLKKREAGRAASREMPLVDLETDTVVLPTEEQIVAATVESPSAIQAAMNVEKPESTEDMKDVYDELFGLTK
jgi:hypothetical protein